MHTCFNCNAHVMEDNIYPHINKCLKTGDSERVVVVCPACGYKTVTGGEPDIDYDGSTCIMMFGEDFNPKYHNGLPKVIGIRDYPSIDFDSANWLVVGQHDNMGSGVLSCHKYKHEAEIHMKNIKDGLREGTVVPKEDLLMGE